MDDTLEYFTDHVSGKSSASPSLDDAPQNFFLSFLIGYIKLVLAFVFADPVHDLHALHQYIQIGKSSASPSLDDAPQNFFLSFLIGYIKLVLAFVFADPVHDLHALHQYIQKLEVEPVDLPAQAIQLSVVA